MAYSAVCWDRAHPVDINRCGTQTWLESPSNHRIDVRGPFNRSVSGRVNKRDVDLKRIEWNGMTMLMMVIMHENPPLVASGVCLVGVVDCSGSVSQRRGNLWAFKVSRYTKGEK